MMKAGRHAAFRDLDLRLRVGISGVRVRDVGFTGFGDGSSEFETSFSIGMTNFSYLRFF